MAASVELLNATAIAAGRKAVLFMGPSGSGKSDLALRCLSLGPSALMPETAQLVSDDYVEAFVQDSQLIVRPPATLKGKLEVRGVGIFNLPHTAEAIVHAVFQLDQSKSIERLPLPQAQITLLGCQVPCLTLHPFEASAAAKVLLFLNQDPAA